MLHRRRITKKEISDNFKDYRSKASTVNPKKVAVETVVAQKVEPVKPVPPTPNKNFAELMAKITEMQATLQSQTEILKTLVKTDEEVHEEIKTE